MARARKTTAKKAAKKVGKKTVARRRPRPTPGPAPVAPNLASADLTTRLTAEILELDRTGKRAVVENVVAIGERLLDLQKHLGLGKWLQWLSDELPYSPRTAQRYISIAVWAQDNPEDFEQFAHLGVGKLQLLAPLPRRERRKFRSNRTFPIPGGDKRKSVEVMTHIELAAILAASRDLAIAPPTIPIDRVLGRFRHRVAGLDALADTLRERADEIEHDDVRQLHEEILAVAEELAATFDL